MTAGLFESIRVAIRAKAAADVTDARGATLGRARRAVGGLPRVFVGIPTFALAQDGRPQSHIEDYVLTFPGSIEVAAPAGEQRADTEALELLRLLIVGWRAGIQLGLGDSGVVGSWVSSASPAYDENDLLTGYEVTWTVRLMETLATGRTV